MTSRIVALIALILMIHGWLIESTPMMVDGVVATFISIFIRGIEETRKKKARDGK
jgi:hypothetical protein